MLNKLRNFAKTKIAGVVIGIIIIPFVFWGMGGVFSGGNTNNIAKINNKSISTQDFMDHLNSSRISLKTIKDNIENNILEEILTELISKKMIQLEEQNLNLIISDKILKKRIKENENFLDENKKFSRVKYEKFLLSSNITAVDFETKLRKNELKKNLFSYIVGGIKSPAFLSNNTFKEHNISSPEPIPKQDDKICDDTEPTIEPPVVQVPQLWIRPDELRKTPPPFKKNSSFKNNSKYRHRSTAKKREPC